MIELQKIETPEDPTGFYGALWADVSHADTSYVIAEEDGRFHVRDESGDLGSYPTLAAAFEYLQVSQVWGEVTLAPANRLREVIEEGRTHAIADFLLEYLADYGAVGIDAQALARRVFERIEES